jgi:hypothetical protein
VASALGSSAVSVDQCARWRSPWKLKPSWIVAGRPSRGTELIAMRPVLTSL